MVIFLYGADDYRRTAKKKEILEEFRKRQSNLGVGIFDFSDENDFQKFQDFLKNQSLFQTAKLGVLDGGLDATFAKSLKGKDFIKILKNILDDKNLTVLISQSEKPIKAFEFLLEKPVVAQKFEVLKEKEWEVFVRNEIKKLEINISGDAVRFLIQVYEGDTWSFMTELQKISFFNSNQEVQIKDLENLGIELNPNFWSLVWGFKNVNLKERMWALEKVLGTREPAAKIFNILAYQLSGRISDFAKFDWLVKSGKLEYEEALLQIVISQ